MLKAQGPFGNPALTAPPPRGYGAPPNPDNPFVIYQDAPSKFDVKETGESGELRWHGLGEAGLTVIAAHRDVDYNFRRDQDSSAARFSTSVADQRARQDSVEARLASESGGPLTWQVGAYYFREKGFSDIALSVFAPSGALLLLARPRLEIDSRSEALFGQATYALNDRLNLTGGLRYTWDKKDAVQYIRSGPLNIVTPSSTSWLAPTGKVTVDYTLISDAFLYGTISRGYKAGGYSLDGPAFNPEKIWAYEAGLKTRLFDRRLQLNFSAFYYTQKDLQVSQTGIGNSGAPILITDNAGAATTRGAEVEFQATPVRDLQLRGSVAYLHARYDQYTSVDQVNAAAGPQNLAGRPAVFAPDWTVSFDASYRWDLGRLGSLEPGVSFYWADKQNLRVFATPPGDIQPAYDTVDLRLLYRPPVGSWSVEAFADNVGNKIYKLNVSAGSLTGTINAGYAPPRTYGVKVAVDF
jgi:iron complex outermembrane recepter protein